MLPRCYSVSWVWVKIINRDGEAGLEQATLNHMAVLRIISGLMEIGIAILFLKSGRVDTALRLNAFLGLIGPLVFILVSVLGIAAIAVKLSWTKVVILVLGLALVLLGTKS